MKNKMNKIIINHNLNTFGVLEALLSNTTWIYIDL